MNALARIEADRAPAGTASTVSRRAVLAGGAAIALPASATSRPSGSAAWARALSRLHAAKHAFEVAFDAMEQFETRYYAGCPVDPIPDKWGWDFTQAAWETKEKLRADWQSRCEAWRIESGLARVQAVSRAAGDRMHEAYVALIELPAPDHHAVVAKLAFACESGLELADVAEDLAADLRRLGHSA